MVFAGDELISLNVQANHVVQSKQQQSHLSPGSGDLVLAHGDTGEAAQPEVIDDAQGGPPPRSQRWD
jgi:hypothetical protein